MQHPNQGRHSYRPDIQAACRKRKFLFLSPFLASALWHPMPCPCHACLQMAVHESQKSHGKKARKTATSSGFRDLRRAPPGCLLQKGSAVGTHCFCGSASLGCCVLRFAINTCYCRRPRSSSLTPPSSGSRAWFISSHANARNSRAAAAAPHHVPTCCCEQS